MDKTKIILLGDSIRMGYQPFLVGYLKDRADVWAPEENCEDSACIIRNKEKWFAGKSPDIIYINCGLHDIYLDKGETCRRSVDDYGANLEAILNWIHGQYAHASMIVATTTPVIESRQITSPTYLRLVRKNSDVVCYNKRMTKIAAARGFKVDDLHGVLSKESIENMLIEDGIHLNAKAADLLGRHIADTITNHIAMHCNKMHV